MELPDEIVWRSQATLLFSPVMLFVPKYGIEFASVLDFSRAESDENVASKNAVKRRRKKNVRQALGISAGAVQNWVLVLCLAAIVSQIASVAFLGWILVARLHSTLEEVVTGLVTYTTLVWVQLICFTERVFDRSFHKLLPKLQKNGLVATLRDLTSPGCLLPRIDEAVAEAADDLMSALNLVDKFVEGTDVNLSQEGKATLRWLFDTLGQSKRLLRVTLARLRPLLVFSPDNCR